MRICGDSSVAVEWRIADEGGPECGRSRLKYEKSSGDRRSLQNEYVRQRPGREITRYLLVPHLNGMCDDECICTFESSHEDATVCCRKEQMNQFMTFRNR